MFEADFTPFVIRLEQYVGEFQRRFLLFIAVGFVYLRYSLGDYSTGYQLCKDSILADVRTGTYQSENEIIAALKAC